MADGSTKLTPDEQAVLDLAVALSRLKEQAFRLGLYRTAHAIDDATNMIGWEIAISEKK